MVCAVGFWLLTPAGFELRSRVNARYYTIVVYRVAAKRWVSRRALVALALACDPELVVERR
jgi:hypothetical protein